MFVIEINKLSDRKKKAICVYNTEEKNPVRYVIGYINHHEDLFKQALVDSKNVHYIEKDDEHE